MILQQLVKENQNEIKQNNNLNSLLKKRWEFQKKTDDYDSRQSHLPHEMGQVAADDVIDDIYHKIFYTMRNWIDSNSRPIEDKDGTRSFWNKLNLILKH